MTSQQRIRSLTTAPVSEVLNWKTQVPADTGPWTDHFYDVLSALYENTMTDYVTDRFFERLSEGEIINNPCSRVDHRLVATGGNIEYRRISVPTKYQAEGSGSFTYWVKDDWPADASLRSLVDSSDFKGIAKLTALSKIDSTPYQFAEDLGEIHETIKFLKSPLNGILNLANAFRKRQYRYGKRLLTRKKDVAKATADAYLEFRFAASPLYRSAMSLHEAIHATIKAPERRTARGAIEEKQEIVESSEPGVVYYSYDWSAVHSVKVKANILYEVSNPLTGLGWNYGLRLKDIPVTMWELVPLSFMVDRIVNIRQGISAMVNFLDPRVRILAASVTTRDEKLFNIRVKDCIHTDYQMTANSETDTVDESQFSYDRVVWEPNAADIAPIINTRPLLRDISSIADLTSLIVTKLKG